MSIIIEVFEKITKLKQKTALKNNFQHELLRIENSHFPLEKILVFFLKDIQDAFIRIVAVIFYCFPFSNKS